MTRRFLFVGDSESQVLPAFKVAQRFAERGWTIAGNIVPGKSQPTRRQLAATGIDCSLSTLTVHQLFERDVVWNFDAIFVMLPGSAILGFRARLENALQMRPARSRPILVTGYNGVVYERHLEGLLWRIGYDFIAVNSQKDLREFTQSLESLGCPANTLISTGIIHAQRNAATALEKLRDVTPGNIVFATQAVVPSAQAERAYLLERLRSYALAHPERTVFVKSRAMPDERTFHKEKHHYENLYRQIYGDSRPANLVFGCGPLASYLLKVSLLVSVSSTAVLEAIAGGVPGAILADVGLKESLGNHFFVNSGMVTTLDALTVDRWPRPDIAWLEDNGFHPDDTLDALIESVTEKLAGGTVGTGDLEFSPVYYNRDTAPYIFETRLPFKPEAPKPPPPTGFSERAYRKTRKLLTSPGEFVRDTRLAKGVRALRGR